MPPRVIDGYVNDSLEPVYFQVMLGTARPDLMGYTDPDLFARRVLIWTRRKNREPRSHRREPSVPYVRTPLRLS